MASSVHSAKLAFWLVEQLQDGDEIPAEAVEQQHEHSAVLPFFTEEEERRIARAKAVAQRGYGSRFEL